jgi:hypothetical protein
MLWIVGLKAGMCDQAPHTEESCDAPSAGLTSSCRQPSALSTICEVRFDTSICVFNHSASVLVPIYCTGKTRDEAAASSIERSSALLITLIAAARFASLATSFHRPAVFRSGPSSAQVEGPRRPPQHAHNWGMKLIGASASDWTR